MLDEIADGRTDLVFEYVAAGTPATSSDRGGVSLLQWCAYYGDVSAMKFLLSRGASLDSLGENLGLAGACFHGHWRLCKFLIDSSANVNLPSPDNGETPLHSALCKANSPAHTLVVRVLLAHGADPNCATKPGVETGGFMRDCRTKAETPLHRAAAFGEEEAIQLLLDAGAAIDALDVNGDSPLTWASWYLRPTAILRKLCYGDFRIHPKHESMDAYLRGKPHV
jgi:uncharacterized protein